MSDVFHGGSQHVKLLILWVQKMNIGLSDKITFVE